jgi:DNA-directed RNA polymerase specialized sigma24 family protein
METQHDTVSVLDAEQFGRAYERGFTRTVALLCSKGVQTEAATEFAQSAWARAWERRADLRRHEVLQAWVNSIAMNTFRNWIRETQSRRVEQAEPSYAPSLLTQRFARELLDLAHEDARYLEHYYSWGFSAEQIAAHDHTTSGAIRVRLCRARQRLRVHCCRRPRLPMTSAAGA